MRVDSILNIYDLTEANILNIKDEYKGVSIAGYLKTYADNLPAQHQKPFYKKITGLLVNDERFHYAIREVPADAPDWAKVAVEKQELFAFQPSQELNDTLEQITHYLAAAADDAVKSPSPDQKIVAQRELDAFPKAENLDVIKKKSDEFFKRGSRKAGREIAGMEQMFDAGDGFVWYKLVDEEAFRREGKALQNCIGSIYTAARMKRDNQMIAVLKTSSNESAAAMRINIAKKEMEEVKGKNNKPPIERYMTATIAFLNQMKLKPGYNAMYDLKNAGYYYDEDKEDILTKAQAIQRFVTTTPIAKVGQGLTLTKGDVSNKTLFQDLYGNLLGRHRSFSRYQEPVVLNMQTPRQTPAEKLHPDIYELRDSSNIPTITAIVSDGKLLGIGRHRQEATVQEAEAETVETSTPTLLLITQLLKLGLITTMDQSIQRQILWQERLRWDAKTKEFVSLGKSDREVDTDKKHMKWKVYDDPSVVKQLFTSLASEDNDDDKGMVGDYTAKDIVRIYVDNQTTTTDDEDGDTEVTHMILQTRDGAALPVRAIYKQGSGEVVARFAGFQGTNRWHPGDRSERVVNSLVGLANKEKLALPKSVRLNHGIVRSKGHYERFEPKFEKVAGKQSAIKLDLSDQSPGDRLAALTYVASNSKYVGSTTDHRDDILSIADAIRHGHWTATSGEDVGKWEKGELHRIYKDVFRGGTPETLYVVDIEYGTDKKAKVTLLVDGTKVIRVDNTTTTQRWQKWTDYDKVAQQLNQFAEEHGLRYEPAALVSLRTPKASVKNHTGELRIADGKVTTAATEKTKSIEGLRQRGLYQMEGTDELKFEDGAKIVRMPPAKQAAWVRGKMSGEGGQGEGWEIYDKDGKAMGIITVNRGGNLMSMYGRGSGYNASTDITDRGIVPNLLPYVKKAAETFGWKTEKSRMMNIAPDGKLHRTLSHYRNYASSPRRAYLRDPEKLLKAMGFLSNSLPAGRGDDRMRSNRYQRLTITDEGKAALTRLNGKGKVGVMGNVTGAALPKDFEAPARRARPKKERAAGAGKWKVSTAAPRSGTKAELALGKFREMTNDGVLPTRSQFISILTQPPFNMSKSGAQTYYYTTKAKYAALGESLSELAMRQLKNDPILQSFKRFLLG
ncbi:hypothetical protein E4H12_11450 [Candidatus Thorarchaeota archaeon]|nr:MAG: hypothetical protein E4H12_11450 [Candidatus Thorarchaeota archaeon]